MKIKSKTLRKQATELNDIIHNRNLYSAGRRYIFADVEHTAAGEPVLTVQDLYTEKRVPFINDGSFVDGYGKQVVL
jgi:hypothetical protein